MKKVCKKCGIEKDLSEFRKDKYRKDGHTSYCKHCIDNRYTNVCECCGKTFTCGQKKQKCCSKACMGIMNKRRVKFNCEYCGKEAEVIKSEFDRREHHYCSVECRNKNHGNVIGGENNVRWKDKIKVNCDFCGKEIEKLESQYVLSKYHYCSTRCMGDHRVELYAGEGGTNWQGGITNESDLLRGFFRRSAKQWRDDSIEKCNARCVITGKEYECVHHLFSLNFIMEKAFEETGISKKNLSEYSETEKNILRDKGLELHYRYGLGICLTKKVHEEFHIKYGYKDISSEDFEEFMKSYKSA